MAISRFVGGVVPRDLRTTFVGFLVVIFNLGPRLYASGVLLPESFAQGTFISCRYIHCVPNENPAAFLGDRPDRL